MANSLPPGFSGIDFTQWNTWPVVVIDGLQYRTIPGNSQYVFDPYDGANGSIKVNPTPVKKALEAEMPAEPGIAEQVAPTAGLIAGVYGAKTLFGGGAAAAPAATTAGTGAAAAGTTGGAGILAPAATTGGATAGSGAAGATAAEAGAGFSGSMILPVAAIAAGTYLGGKSAYNMLQGKSDNSTQGKLGRGILGMATGGLSEVARPMLMHKSTRDRQADTTERLLGASDDPTYQSYVQGMREQFKNAPPDPSKPFAGKYSTFGEYQKAGLQAGDLSGVEGNINTYGKDWAHLTQAQREAVTQENINSGIYASEDGGVQITDEAKARENYTKVINAANQPKSGGILTITGPKVEQPKTSGWVIRNGKAVRK